MALITAQYSLGDFMVAYLKGSPRDSATGSHAVMIHGGTLHSETASNVQRARNPSKMIRPSIKGITLSTLTPAESISGLNVASLYSP